VRTSREGALLPPAAACGEGEELVVVAARVGRETEWLGKELRDLSPAALRAGAADVDDPRARLSFSSTFFLSQHGSRLVARKLGEEGQGEGEEEEEEPADAAPKADEPPPPPPPPAVRQVSQCHLDCTD
jgi:hypothetical protein